MTKEDNFIVAIELGSSKVTAIAGRKQPDGAILILAYAQEPSESFMRKGRINNFNKMISCITGLKKKLEEKLHKSIACTYVGIGGMGMHTKSNTVSRQLGEKMLVTQPMVANLMEDNKNIPHEEKEILAVIPQDYKLGAQTGVTDPVGIYADAIEGHFLNVIANNSVTENVHQCFRNAGLLVEATPISVMTLADAILTEPEKRSGCVFVDMGAETTSVAVYKNNLLRHLAIIPLGGGSINRDLQSQQIEEAEAETLKRKYGQAYRQAEDEEHEPITLSDGRIVKYEEFAGLVEARVEEIVLNINNQIEQSKYDKTQLIAGLVITGGAAAMKGMDKAFAEYTKFEKIRFVKTLRLQYRFERNAPANFNADGSYSAAIALIDKGEKNCCGGELGEENRDIFSGENANNTTGTSTTGNNVAGTTGGTNGGTAAGESQTQGQDNAGENASKEEEEAASKKPKFGGLKKFWNKFTSMASNIVDDNDEEHFINSKSKDNNKNKA